MLNFYEPEIHSIHDDGLVLTVKLDREYDRHINFIIVGQSSLKFARRSIVKRRAYMSTDCLRTILSSSQKFIIGNNQNNYHINTFCGLFFANWVLGTTDLEQIRDQYPDTQ